MYVCVCGLGWYIFILHMIFPIMLVNNMRDGFFSTREVQYVQL